MTNEKNDGAWTYETFSQDMPARDFGPFEDFVSLWRSKWVGDSLPAWRDFEFDDFNGWHGWLIVEDIIPDGSGDVRFRLWGTEVTELFEMDLTGKLMSELGEESFDPEEFELVKRIVQEGVILRSTGSLAWRGRGYRKVTTLELPLADDGNTVNKILCGVRQEN